MGTNSNSTPPDQTSAESPSADRAFDSEAPEISGDGSGLADVGSLLNAAMLTLGSTDPLGDFSSGDIYDGNVSLAGDLTLALDSTLDLLTTTTSLFDVPVLDIGSSDALDG